MARKLESIGFIAAILTIISFYSLVYHNHSIQNTTSLSPIWLGTTFLIQVLWLIFSIANDIRPTLLSAPISIIGLFYLIYLKLKLETNII